MIQREILKKHCWWKDLSWLKKRINKRLVNNNVDILIEQLIPILDNVYGNNWDIQFEFINPSLDYMDYELNTENPKHKYNGLVPYTMNIIIHYPEITITNTFNLEHTIKDLYVRIPMFICNLRKTSSGEGSYNKPFIKKIEGSRFTCNKLEYLSGYLHSHLNKRSKYDFCEEFYEFCIGEGPMTLLVGQLNELLSEIPTRSNNLKLDLNLFELYFRHINNYVKWESLEGGPYIRIEKINYVNKLNINLNYRDSDLRYIFNFFKSKIKDLELNFTFNINNELINIVINDTFYNIINNILQHQLTIEKKVKDDWNDNWTINSNYQILYLKDSNDIFYSTNYNLSFMSVDINTYKHNLRSKSYFRNEEINFKLEEVENNQVDNKQYLHPHIYNYIKEQIINYLNEQRFKQKYFSKQS